MPIQPLTAEKKPPKTKAKGVTGLTSPSQAIAANNKNNPTKTPVTTRYWRLRYAIAPSRTAWAISIMRGVPSRTCITLR